MLSSEFLQANTVLLEAQKFLAVALTGTREKFDTLEKILKVEENVYIPGILGCIQFADAGKAAEPVTPDSLYLMVGKQEGQRELFLDKLAKDKELRDKHNSEIFLLSSNDVNTIIEGEPLTKSPVQKETKLDIHEYNDLITASLKYLAMKNAGVKVGYTWKQMQADWKLIQKCLDNPWDGRVFLPIDYQTIDAFDLEKLVVEGTNTSFEKQGPTIAVINRAYATLELDFRKGNALVKGIVSNYQQNNWKKEDFDPNRFPLGIEHRELLKSFVLAHQHVLISDHIEHNGKNLKEIDFAEMLLILERIEVALNGFNKESVNLARAKYTNTNPQDKNYLFVVTRKPGNDQVRRLRLPKLKCR